MRVYIKNKNASEKITASNTPLAANEEVPEPQSDASSYKSNNV